MSDYLWDRSGPRDEEIEKLESALARLRYRKPLDSQELAAPRFAMRNYLAIAACVLLAVAAWWLQPAAPNQSTSWAMSGSGKRLVTGQRLSTGNSLIKLEDEDFGEVEVLPHSDLSVLESAPGRQRMTLERGGLHAYIWAPPRQFVVETPSARAIDLGCEYNLTVDRSGDGFVAVETGWVAFQFRNNESFIPAGAACRTSKRTGPGVPFFQDASATFSAALQQYEISGNPEALAHVLTEARPKDGLSLWHLLTRVTGQQRRDVFNRFTQLVTVPSEVNAERVLAGDSHALDLCWNALGLDDADWWREWKRDWKP